MKPQCFAARRWLLAVALLLAGIVLTGCQSIATEPSPERRANFRGVPVILWVDWAGAKEELQDAASAQAFAQNARGAGVTHLALEAVNAEGQFVLGPDSPNSAARENMRRAAGEAGLRLAAVLPLFIATPKAEEEELASRAEWTGEEFRLTTQFGGENAPALVSPASPEARQRELDRIHQIASDSGIEILILSGLPFADSLADLGPIARKSFQAHAGVTARNWPGDVIGNSPSPVPFGPADRGPLWNVWNMWRAQLAHQFLIRAREEFALIDGAPPELAALVDAPYPAHQRQGLNWAHPRSPAATDYSWLPEGYNRHAAGHLLDAVILGFWEAGLLRATQAEEEGYAWWASIESATATAHRYSRGGTGIWGAVETRQDQWPPAARTALRINEGLLLLPASQFIENPEEWESLRLAIENAR